MHKQIGAIADSIAQEQAAAAAASKRGKKKKSKQSGDTQKSAAGAGTPLTPMSQSGALPSSLSPSSAAPNSTSAEPWQLEATMQRVLKELENAKKTNDELKKSNNKLEKRLEKLENDVRRFLFDLLATTHWKFIRQHVELKKDVVEQQGKAISQAPGRLFEHHGITTKDVTSETFDTFLYASHDTLSKSSDGEAKELLDITALREVYSTRKSSVRGAGNKAAHAADEKEAVT
ncbi:hypothetical protein FA95DRAFT_1573324 [Auriscalpium vulgare]|uniref:Uncharacterized protein n=1 Tax=Auriscalpium vulgare TaxID=40419 RepID=A0ACB8RQH0_9AGAM|nr:hypothetical protein FA95DRAFT_1573324 [Auriscalpium vulgare]